MIGRGLGDGGEPIGAVPRVGVPLVYPNAIDARRGGTVAQCDWRQTMRLLLMLRISASDRNRMLVVEFAGRHAFDPHQTTPGFTRSGDAHFLFSCPLTPMRHSLFLLAFYSYSTPLVLFVHCKEFLVFYHPRDITSLGRPPHRMQSVRHTVINFDERHQQHPLMMMPLWR